MTVTANPLSFRYATQSPQQPQVGDKYTSISCPSSAVVPETAVEAGPQADNPTSKREAMINHRRIIGYILLVFFIEAKSVLKKSWRHWLLLKTNHIMHSIYLKLLFVICPNIWLDCKTSQLLRLYPPQSIKLPDICHPFKVKTGHIWHPFVRNIHMIFVSKRIPGVLFYPPPFLIMPESFSSRRLPNKINDHTRFAG